MIEEQHPFIRALVEKLPKPETRWTSEERVKWLRAACSCFDLIYMGNDIPIRVSEYSPDECRAVSSAGEKP